MPDLSTPSDEQRALRDVIRQMAEERIAPRAHDVDELAEYPRELRELLAEHDVFGLPFDTRHGGMGTGRLMLDIAIEQVAHGSAATAFMLVLHDLGTLPVRLAGDDEVQERLLPRCAAGEWTPAFALHDLPARSTTAVADGGGWVIRGGKALVANAGVADFYVVFAATEAAGGALSALVVEPDRPGVVVGPREEMLGLRGVPVADVMLEDVFVPAGHLLGTAGGGGAIAEAALGQARLGVAAMAVGIAQAATDYAAAYAGDRRQFGRAIDRFEGIQLKLGGMAIRCAAARALLHQASAMVDRGDAAAERHASMAKAFATDAAADVAADAVQVLGGYGFIRDYPVERLLRDAQAARIQLGGNDARRMAVARSLP